MEVVSCNLHYNVEEFSFLVTQMEDECVSVLELLVDCKMEDFDEEDFNNTFVINTEDLTYVFPDFKVHEYFEDKGCIRVVCVR